MNERIKEIAEQAGGVFIHKLMSGAKQYTFLEKDLEKFAELIIKECAEVAEDYDGAHYVGTAIKQHFGVGE